MSTKSSFVGLNHAFMKIEATLDYEYMKQQMMDRGLPIAIPKGKHWHRIEDAIFAMIKMIPEIELQNLSLPRGPGMLEYYFSL